MLKIIGVNLLVLVTYVSIILLNSAAKDKGFNIAIGIGVCMFIHVALNAIVGIVFLVINKRDVGRALLISAGILMPVGFVTWLILLSIFG